LSVMRLMVPVVGMCESSRKLVALRGSKAVARFPGVSVSE